MARQCVIAATAARIIRTMLITGAVEFILTEKGAVPLYLIPKNHLQVNSVKPSLPKAGVPVLTQPLYSAILRASLTSDSKHPHG